MTFPFGQEIVLIRRTSSGQDDYGDDAGTITEETVRGAFSPGGVARGWGTGAGAESETLGLVVQPTVYLPYGAADLTFLDAVRVNGITYEIDGAPIPWTNPLTGSKPGVEVRLSTRET